MEDYIVNLRVKFEHTQPAKPQHSPYKHAPILYSAKIQYAAGPNESPPWTSQEYSASKPL